MSEPGRDEPPAPDPRFPVTHWHVVRQAVDSSDPGSQAAMGELLQRYWKPLYTFLRHPRWALLPEDAMDLVQEFCLALLEDPGSLARAERGRGRFRDYLRGALSHFVMNKKQATRAKKRGGGKPILPLDAMKKELEAEPAPGVTPEASFLFEWARTVMEAARERLREELLARGTPQYFEAFRLSLDGLTYREIAERLSTDLTSVTNWLHRAREQFSKTLRAVVLPTVGSEAEAEDEIRELLAVLEAERGG